MTYRVGDSTNMKRRRHYGIFGANTVTGGAPL